MTEHEAAVERFFGDDALAAQQQFLGEIPIDPKVVVGGDSGEPIFVLDPLSAAAEAFRQLAATVVEQVESGHAGHTHALDEHVHAYVHAEPRTRGGDD